MDINYLCAVVKNGHGTEEEKLQVLAKDGSYLAYIKEPTYEMKKVAVEQNGFALKYISDPDTELIALAIAKSPTSSQYVQNTTEEIVSFILDTDPSCIRYMSKGITKDDWIKCVKKLPSLIRYIPRQFLTRSLCLEAGLKDVLCIKYIPEKHITPKMQLEWASKYGMAIQFLNVEEDEIYFAAITQDPIASKFVKDINNIDKLAELVKASPNIIDGLNATILKKLCKKLIKN